MSYKIFLNRKINSVSYFYSSIKYTFVLIYIGIALFLMTLGLIMYLRPEEHVNRSLDLVNYLLINLYLPVVAIPITALVCLFILPIGFIIGIIYNKARIASLGLNLFTVPIFKMFSGKLGKILSKLYLFDVDGDIFCEEGFISEFHYQSGEELFKELNIYRGRDLFLFPLFIASFFATYFFNSIFDFMNTMNWQSSTNLLRFYDSLLKPMSIFLIPFLLGIVPILVHILILPSLLMLDEAGIKVVQYGNGGNIKSINLFGSSIRSGLSKIFGFSAILNLILIISSLQNISLLDLLASLIWGRSNGYQSAPFTTWESFLLAIPFMLVLGAMLMPLSNLGILPIFENYSKSIENIRSNLSRFNIETIGSVVGTFRYGTEPKTDIAVVEGIDLPISTFDKMINRLFGLAFPFMIFTIAIPVIFMPLYVLINITNDRFIKSLTEENLFIALVFLFLAISLVVILIIQRRKNIFLGLCLVLLSMVGFFGILFTRTLAVLTILESVIFIFVLILQRRRSLAIDININLYLVFWSIFVIIFYFFLVNRFFFSIINF